MLMMPVAIMAISNEDDREFIKRLFLENELAMFIMAVKIVRDYHIARDMVSESCITMINKIDYLKNIDVCKQTFYIMAIVKNNSLMYLRRRKIERRVLMEGQYMLSGEINEGQESVDSKLIAEAEMKMVSEVLSNIHKRDKELLHMKYFEQISDAEIAQRMGIGVNSVRFYLTKARRNFSNDLERRKDN